MTEDDKQVKEEFLKMNFPDPALEELETKLEPQLEPQCVYGNMLDYVPEKTELCDGILYWGEPWISRMFLLHLYHIGLNEAVKFAPKEMWLKALENLEKD